MKQKKNKISKKTDEYERDSMIDEHRLLKQQRYRSRRRKYRHRPITKSGEKEVKKKEDRNSNWIRIARNREQTSRHF